MGVELCNMARCSGKSVNLRKINSMRCRAINKTIYIWESDTFKIKIVMFIVHFGRNNIIRNGQKANPKTRLCENVYKRFGNNRFLPFKNSGEVLDKLKARNFNTTSYDFFHSLKNLEKMIL